MLVVEMKVIVSVVIVLVIESVTVLVVASVVATFMAVVVVVLAVASVVLLVVESVIILVVVSVEVGVHICYYQLILSKIYTSSVRRINPEKAAGFGDICSNFLEPEAKVMLIMLQQFVWRCLNTSGEESSWYLPDAEGW